MTIPNYTNPHTWATGDAVPASTLNSNLRDNVAFLAAAKYVQLGLTANQSISNASWNTVNWSVANAETVEAWGASPYPDRISPRLAGYYQVTLFALWTANSTGYRASQLLFNGARSGCKRRSNRSRRSPCRCGSPGASTSTAPVTTSPARCTKPWRRPRPVVRVGRRADLARLLAPPIQPH